MTGSDFDCVRKLLREHASIALDDGKEYLVEARLIPLAKKRNLTSLADLVEKLRSRSDPSLLTQVVEAMVTTETSFFRDIAPFEALRTKVLPELIERRRAESSLRIWCAASSTGQEPYSIAMLIREHFPQLSNWNLSILATDISEEVLSRAREGKFNQIEANRGLPIKLLLKYFTRHGLTWQISDEIRRMVEFRRLNLADAWSNVSRIDLVLIRNVMIYFDVETKASILRRIATVLRPDGYLLLGGAETTFQLVDCFQRVEYSKSSFYQVKGGA